MHASRLKYLFSHTSLVPAHTSVEEQSHIIQAFEDKDEKFARDIMQSNSLRPMKVIEDLPFIHDRDVRAKFNRVTHPFNSRAMLTAIERHAFREKVALIRCIQPILPRLDGSNINRNTGSVSITPPLSSWGDAAG